MPSAPFVGLQWRRPTDGEELMIASDQAVLLIHGKQGARVFNPDTAEAQKEVIETVKKLVD